MLACQLKESSKWLRADYNWIFEVIFDILLIVILIEYAH